MIRRILLVAAVAIGLGGSAFADAEAAKAAYAKGASQYNLQNYSEALGFFKHAYEEKADPAFLFNIAQCYRLLNRYEEASRSYHAYLRESPTLPPATLEQVQKLVAMMDKAVEEQRAKQPPTGMQPPATENAPAAVQAEPTPTPPPAPPAATERDANEIELHRAKTKQLAGAVTAGVGVVALVLGGVFTGLASSANHDIATGTTWSPSAQDRRDHYQAADIAMFVVGGAALASGLAVYLIGRHEASRKYPVDRVQLVPTAGMNAAGAMLSGSF
ncbi:MAG TPA: hypothetical protein VIA18_29615 [Polyangia bacterium]|jgi:tetratricopeptide (TPR) repeat protein|nr:hypothetical protein [Polyangia bacterium]